MRPPVGPLVPGAGIYVPNFTFTPATLPDYSSNYFPVSPATSPCQVSVGDVSLDASGVTYKRAIQATSGYNYSCGFFLARNVVLGGVFGMRGVVGGYSTVDVVVAPPGCFNTSAPCGSYIRLSASLSSLGIPSGGVGQWSGVLLATDPPSFSFVPANPAVAYSSVRTLVSSKVNILFGYYSDATSTKATLWAASRNDSIFVVGSATPPPEVGVAWGRQLSQYEALVATWDGEWRLWVRGRDRGIVVPLGRGTRVLYSSPLQRADPSVYGDAGRALPAGREAVELIVETEHPNLYTKTRRWRAVVAVADDGSVWAALGDTAWDGDRIGYLFAYLPHDS
ncbi:MAG: hypothetical protein ACP5HP_02115 [Thermogladius sp.]